MTFWMRPKATNAHDPAGDRRILRHGGALAVAIAVALAIALAACGDDEADEPAADQTATPSPETSPTPELTGEGQRRPVPPNEIAGVPAGPVEPAGKVELRDRALIVETRACSGCDTAGGLALVRFYESESGELVQDTLFDPQIGDDPNRILRHNYRDGRLTVHVCTQGYCGGMGGPDANDGAEVTAFDSNDGGLTWEAGEPREYDAWRQGDEWAEHRSSHGPDSYLELDDGSRIRISSDSRRLVQQNGETYFALTGSQLEIVFARRIADSSDIYLVLEAPASGTHFAALLREGAVAWATRSSDASAWAGSYMFAGFAGLLDPGAALAIGSTPSGVAPVVVDLESNTVRALEGVEPAAVSGKPDDDLEPGALLPVAAIQGPFVRVSDTGTCLNVRTQPSVDASVVDCYVDGVLLRELGDTRAVAGRDWLHVETPAGEAGWVTSEYVER